MDVRGGDNLRDSVPAAWLREEGLELEDEEVAVELQLRQVLQVCLRTWGDPATCLRRRCLHAAHKAPLPPSAFRLALQCVRLHTGCSARRKARALSVRAFLAFLGKSSSASGSCTPPVAEWADRGASTAAARPPITARRDDETGTGSCSAPAPTKKVRSTVENETICVEIGSLGGRNGERDQERATLDSALGKSFTTRQILG